MDSNRSQQTNEAQTLPMPMADGAAVNLTVAQKTGLLLSVSDLSLDQRRALADRAEFPMSREALERWEELEARPARDLPDLRELMAWRSPYIAYDDSEPDSTES